MRKVFFGLRLVALFIMAGSAAYAQPGFWKIVSESGLHINQDVRQIVPKKYRTLELDTFGMKAFMESAPQELHPMRKTTR